MHQASVGWHCPVCVRDNQRQPAARTARRVARRSEPYVSYVVLAACVAVFVWDAVGGPRTGAAWSTRELGLAAHWVHERGEWYRVLGYAFAHASLMHLAFNMWFLWALGVQCERAWGALTFTTTYVVGAIGGALGVFLIEGPALTVGASGSMFALMGATLMLQWRGRINVMDSGILPIVVLNLLISFNGRVSLGGHLGGFVVGVLVGLVLAAARKRGRRAVALAPIAIAALGLVIVIALVPAAARAVSAT